MRARLAHLALLVPTLACGDGEDSGGLALVIETPADHGTTVHQHGQVTVAYHVGGIRLATPGGCGADPRCGHLRLHVDGDACNRNAVTPYNTAGGPSPLSADLNRCPALLGEHVFTLDLRRDDGTPFEPALDASVTAVVDGAPAEPEPSLTITSPSDGATLATTSPLIPIAFEVAHHTLKPKGTCDGAAACGHVLVRVDGAACDRDEWTPFNAAGAASPIEADLARCSTTLGGPHAITALLADDDGEPLKPPVAAAIGIFVATGEAP